MRFSRRKESVVFLRHSLSPHALTFSGRAEINQILNESKQIQTINYYNIYDAYTANICKKYFIRDAWEGEGGPQPPTFTIDFLGQSIMLHTFGINANKSKL